MIRDIFHKRYPDIYFHFPNYLGGAEQIPSEIEAFFNQSAHIIFHDLFPLAKTSKPILNNIYHTFLRELGITSFGEGYAFGDIIINYLQNPYDLWNTNDDISDFIKKKISLIELVFSTIETEVRERNNKNYTEDYDNCVDELNRRFKESKLGFYYNNKSIDTYNDKLSYNNIYEPYWEIMKDEKYKTIDNDIKIAFQKLNSNQSDAAFYSMRALESCIKIISDELSLSTGKEKGASNYIDNLGNKKVKFIERWEADSLKFLFKEIRNPLGHGPGNEEVIALKYFQEKCVIDLVLVWIKSLITRL